MDGHTQPPKVIRLRKQHIPQLAALELTCFTLPWHAEQYQLAFSRRFFHAFGVVENDVLLAYVSIYDLVGTLEILNVATHPEHRRKNLARRILTHIIRLSRRLDLTDAVLEVREHNAPAIRLYEGLGFRRAGLRKAYYTDTGEDAIVYTLRFKE